jgi:hypothetical protein
VDPVLTLLDPGHVDPAQLDAGQLHAVHSDLASPAWLSGPPGTGKTVAALHRLARIGRQRPGRLLYLAVPPTLARVQAARFRRMAPDIAARAEFSSIRDVAADLLMRRGRPVGESAVEQALAELRRAPLRHPYAAAVVDEAHEVSPAGLGLAHAVAGDLLLVGDGPVADPHVPGDPRAAVLRVNYRNAAGVLAGSGLPATAAARDGGRALHYAAACSEDHDSELIAETGQCADRRADVAILTSTEERAVHYRRILHQAGIAAASLTSHDGRRTTAVKVGTIRGAAGLEFSAVLLPRRRRVPPPGDRLGLLAVTRARDFLWSGSVLAG